MKSLSESLFDNDLTSSDPLNDVIDRLDCSKYDIGVVNKAMDQIVELYADYVYDPKSPDKKMVDLSNQLVGKDYILFRQIPSNYMKRFKYRYYKYDVGWPGEKEDNLYFSYFASDYHHKWSRDTIINYDWSLRSFNGITDLLRRSKNLQYEKVFVITDKQFIETLKKYIVGKSK